MSKIAGSKICLIDDEEKILEVIGNLLTLNNHEVVKYDNSYSFLDDLNKLDDISAFLVDQRLPGVPGVEIVKKIREMNALIPIFMLTACGEQEEVINGIEAGADDYIVKPCNLKELYARLKNAILKYTGVKEDKSALKVLDEGNLVMHKGESVSLTSREFAIFKALYSKEGEPVERDKLLSSFEKDNTMIKRNVDVHVFSLRKKLQNISLEVKTIRGIGYKLNRIA
jgi:DNA-binding response OmpR family regulator